MPTEAELALVIKARDQATAVLARLNKEIGTMQRTMGQTGEQGKKTANSFTMMTHAAQGMQKQMLAMNLSMGGMQATMMGVAAIAPSAAGVKLAADFEQVQITMERLLGSEKAAKDMLQELWDFAAKTPFEFPQLTAASQSLLMWKYQAKDILPMMKTIGDAASASPKGMQQAIDSIVRALGQMKAAGKVNSRDMMQLTEAGVNAWEYLAKGMGVTTEQAMKRVEGGSVDSAKGIKMVLAGMDRDFGGMMERQSKTTLGKWSTFKDNASKLLRDFGAIVLPPLNALMDFGSRAMEAFNKLPEPIKNIVGWVSLLAGGALLLSGMAMSMAGGFLTMGLAIKMMLPFLAPMAAGIGSITAAALPWLLIIGAIIAAAALLYLAWTNNFLGIQDHTARFVKWIGEAFGGLWRLFTERVPKALRDLWLGFAGLLEKLIPGLKLLDDATGKERTVKLKGEVQTENNKPFWEYWWDNITRWVGNIMDWLDINPLGIMLAILFPGFGPTITKIANWIAGLGSWFFDVNGNLKFPDIGAALGKFGEWLQSLGPLIFNVLVMLLFPSVGAVFLQFGTWLAGLGPLVLNILTEVVFPSVEWINQQFQNFRDMLARWALFLVFDILWPGVEWINAQFQNFRNMLARWALFLVFDILWPGVEWINQQFQNFRDTLARWALFLVFDIMWPGIEWINQQFQNFRNGVARMALFIVFDVVLPAWEWLKSQWEQHTKGWNLNLPIIGTIGGGQAATPFPWSTAAAFGDAFSGIMGRPPRLDGTEDQKLANLRSWWSEFMSQGGGDFYAWGARVKAMAAGGIATRPTMAMIGEAGPEAVIPLNRFNGGAMRPITLQFVYAPTFSSASEIEMQQAARHLKRYLDRETARG